MELLVLFCSYRTGAYPSNLIMQMILVILRAKSVFVVIKNYYVYRTQFPLILSYAVTKHKCQGLSLDCAIIDLSCKVFADGMAYVALSQVKSLECLHITSFYSLSIQVSLGCIK